MGIPTTGCEPFANADELKGKIVLVTESKNFFQCSYLRYLGGNCVPRKKQKRIYEAGGVGMIMVSVGIGKNSFGKLHDKVIKNKLIQ